MKTVIDWIKKNEATSAAIVAVVALIGFAVACQPTTQSLTDPERQVTRGELEAEVIAANADLSAEEASIRADLDAAKADFARRIAALEASRETIAKLKEQAEEDLARKEQALAEAFVLVEGVVSTAAGPYAPLALGGLSVLALGLGIDNRRKDGVIRGQKIAAA